MLKLEKLWFGFTNKNKTLNDMQAKSVKKWVYRSRTQIAKDKPEKK